MYVRLATVVNLKYFPGFRSFSVSEPQNPGIDFIIFFF